MTCVIFLNPYTWLTYFSFIVNFGKNSKATKKTLRFPVELLPCYPAHTYQVDYCKVPDNNMQGKPFQTFLCLSGTRCDSASNNACFCSGRTLLRHFQFSGAVHAYFLPTALANRPHLCFTTPPHHTPTPSTRGIVRR